MMTTTNPFIRHIIATDPLPPPSSSLYEYLLAGNGLFIRAKRSHLTVQFPLSFHTVRDLPDLHTQLDISVPTIPEALMTSMLLEAYSAWLTPTGPLESLFHFTYADDWILTIPEQERTSVSVRPADIANCPSYHSSFVEIHSHHLMVPKFSRMDDEDETGFRIYGVCGHFQKRPSISFRIGVYGHFFSIPASLIADLPPGVHDTYPTVTPI